MANKEKFLAMAMKPREWYNIEQSEGEATIYIYDQIGMDWWGDGLSANDFVAQVNDLTVKRLNLRINSPGGYITEGKVIYNTIKNLRDIEVWAYVDGIAASVASWLPLAADHRIINENAQVMIHDPWGVAIGNADDMRKTAELLDNEKLSIIGMYQARVNLSEGKLGEMMSNETWMNAAEAVMHGFMDQVDGNRRLAACMFDTSVFDNLPESFLKQQSAADKRNLEKGLRDAGYSRSEAITLASGPRRDADSDAELSELAEALKTNLAKMETSK
jgi:ATP-dependent Clp protease protease subunit